MPTGVYSPRQWLKEGIAEYIAYAPATATAASPRLGTLRRAGKLPDTIRLEPLAATADGQQSDLFYGLAHFATSCLATTYGEPKLFDFVKRTLREKASDDDASRAAFGRPINDVDRDCVSQIHRAVG